MFLRMSWGRLGLGCEKNQGIKKKKEKISLTREFRQALGPSSWRWGGSQALLDFHWLGLASGDGYLSDHRANHVSVPDRPFLRGFLGGIGSGPRPRLCMCLSRKQHCCLAGGVEMEGRTTQQDLGLSFLTMCAIATILDKPA